MARPVLSVVPGGEGDLVSCIETAKVASSAPDQQLQAAKTLVRREVLRQVFAPARVVLCRMMLYYLPRYRGFDRPWISTKNAIASLEKSGAIVPEDVDGVKWYHLPRVQRDRLAAARARNVEVYDGWTASLDHGAAWAEKLWRAAFSAEGWVVPSSQVLIPCPALDDGDAVHVEQHEIDVYATLPGTIWSVACEVRSGPGEGWVGPDVVRDWKLTKAQRNIRHHFRAVSSIGLTPMLAAPFVDPSFYVFQTEYRGVHAKYLYYVFAPEDAPVAADVKDAFRIGHVWAGEEPPGAFVSYVRRLPSVLAKLALRAEAEEESEEPDPTE